MTKLDIDSLGPHPIAREVDPRFRKVLNEMSAADGEEAVRYARALLAADPGNPWAMFVMACNAETAAEEIVFLKEVVRQGIREFEPDGYQCLDLEESSLGWIFSLALDQLADALEEANDPRGADACRELLRALIKENPLVDPSAHDPGPLKMH